MKDEKKAWEELVASRFNRSDTESMLIGWASSRMQKLENVMWAANECARQYFYDNDNDYDDVKYDDAMYRLKQSLREVGEE